MNSAPLFFCGILVALGASWWGIIVAPGLQFGSSSTVFAAETSQHYPPTRPGEALQGAQVYRAAGCNACHTQLVRPEGFGFDLSPEWAPRRTVALDYLRDEPVMLGTIRVGPDLSNVAYRMAVGKTNSAPAAMVAYHLKHLYSPKSVIAGSVMPAYRYLFEKRRIQGQPSPDALKLEGNLAPESGFEIVPRPEAHALMAYLFSLRAEVSIPEAPVIRPAAATNQVAGGTNAPAPSSPVASTNAPK